MDLKNEGKVGLWRRLPVIVRAILTGAIVAALGTTPWAFLVSANTKHWSAVPWAVPLTLIYLWLYWRYLRGEGWPRSSSTFRRMSCRANRLSGAVWGAALLAGFLGLASVVLLQRVINRLVALPHEQALDISQFPFITVMLWVLTSAVVAGVAEEISFRGYMQKAIEQRHGPVIAILLTGLVFGFAHFTHPEVTIVLLPYYVAVAAVYGALACLTDSIYPGMVLHAGGNVLGSLDLIVRGRSEWQTPRAGTSLIWQTGADASFWLSVVLFLLVGSVSVWSYARLKMVAARTIVPSGEVEQQRDRGERNLLPSQGS